MGKAKAIILLGISGVLAGLALAIVLVNAAERWSVWLIFKRVEMRGGTILAYGAVIGCLLWVIWRAAIPAGIRALRASRKAEQTKATEDLLKKLGGDEEAAAEPKTVVTADAEGGAEGAAAADQAGE